MVTLDGVYDSPARDSQKPPQGQNRPPSRRRVGGRPCNARNRLGKTRPATTAARQGSQSLWNWTSGPSRAKIV